MKRIFLLGGIVALLGLLGVFFLLSPKKPSPNIKTVRHYLTQAQRSNVPTSTIALPKREVPAGMQEYITQRFHFSILYPNMLAVKETIDPNGTLTVVFEYDNKDDPKGFQIYVQPYNLPQVTEERFKKDLPSGVRTHMQNVTIAGATGAAFYSQDPNLGDTREVWFLHNGLLYEVTTLKPLEAWFKPILQTWQFVN